MTERTWYFVSPLFLKNTINTTYIFIDYCRHALSDARFDIWVRLVSFEATHLFARIFRFNQFKIMEKTFITKSVSEDFPPDQFPCCEIFIFMFKLAIFHCARNNDYFYHTNKFISDQKREKMFVEVWSPVNTSYKTPFCKILFQNFSNNFLSNFLEMYQI